MGVRAFSSSISDQSGRLRMMALPPIDANLAGTPLNILNFLTGQSSAETAPGKIMQATAAVQRILISQEAWICF